MATIHSTTTSAANGIRTKARSGYNKKTSLGKEPLKAINSLYEEGKDKISDISKVMKVQSQEITEFVQKKPLTSLLIAGGIGFILAALIKR